VPFTDNKFNREALGETKTFAVTERSADALKARINRDNSQELALRAKGSAHLTRTASAQSGQVSPVSDAPAADPVSRRPYADPGADPEFTFLSEPAGNPGSRADREPAADQPVRNLSESLARAMEAETAASKPVPAEARTPAPNQAQPQAQKPAARPIPAQDVEEESELDRFLREHPTRGEGSPSHDRRSAQKAAAVRSAEQGQMAKTRTSDFKVGEVNRAEKKPKQESAVVYEVSDEGGNTVISVIKAIVYIIFVLVSAVALAVFGISVANDMYAFVKSEEAVQVTIPPNTTLDELSQILYGDGVIRYPRIFKLYALYKHDDMDYIAGEYTISPMMNYSRILSEFKEKEITGTVRITIPEGYTTDDIINLFVNRYGIGTREGFVDVIQNYEFDYWFIRELEENGADKNRIYRLDGYLFPDTYDFYLNSSEQTVINRLLRRFSQIFTREYRNQCAELGFTVDQIVTLASMIEKEAAAPSEFFNVSSVFHNRLKMPDVYPRMESDATVVYAIEHETGERTVDLHYDTPYNTYLYDGLPPGPIANPSASAMLAALMVPETNFYYFVSGNGVTYFSETKEEHDQRIEEIRQAESVLNVAEPDAPQTAPADETP
jgi:UPF0755 protein